MNKKGFTLVELIAVIGLLTIIALVGAPLLLNQIASARKSRWNNFKNDMCLAAEAYVNHENINSNSFKNVNDTISISVLNLISGGYVKNNLKYPKVNKNSDINVNTNDSVRLTINENMTYTCEYTCYNQSLCPNINSEE